MENTEKRQKRQFMIVCYFLSAISLSHDLTCLVQQVAYNIFNYFVFFQFMFVLNVVSNKSQLYIITLDKWDFLYRTL